MRKQTKINKHWQLILLSTLTLLLSMTVQAQGTSQDKSQEQTKTSMELKLNTMTTAICIGSPLMLELELTNVSQEDISISQKVMWSNFSYSYYPMSGSGRSGGMSSVNTAREVKVRLQPGMSYRSTYEFPLDSDFFQDPGNYSLKTKVNSIFSNEVKFELYDCGKPKEVEEQKDDDKW